MNRFSIRVGHSLSTELQSEWPTLIENLFIQEFREDDEIEGEELF